MKLWGQIASVKYNEYLLCDLAVHGILQPCRHCNA